MPDLYVMSHTGKAIELPRGTLQHLAAHLHGDLLHQESYGYETTRQVWNGLINKRPALIICCHNHSDVITAVNFARTHNLLLAVRGGGHSVAGHSTCDGGMVIDLSRMNHVSVDQTARIVHVEGGATLADMDKATQAVDLVVPAGAVSDTGIAGLTLGGGIGWLRNQWGLTCDNLLSADVVTADGQCVTASHAEHPDLFWALRGAGGNFGVVTRFTFRAYPLQPDVWFTTVFHDGRHMKEVLQFYREFSATAPDEISTAAICGQFPPGSPDFPAELHGHPCVMIVGMYAGSVEQGQKAMQPLRDFRKPLIDFSKATTYLEAQQFFDEDYPAGELCYYWKSLFLSELTDDAIDTIVEHASQQPSPLSGIEILYSGGAVTRLDDDACAFAFAGRKARYLIFVESNWKDIQDNDANIAWPCNLISALQKGTEGSFYLNFSSAFEEQESTMRHNYGSKYQKLMAIKKRYDPTNLFRLNQNIRPD